jgi:acyl-CoA reductase-like NAD-dependent aldehyde dehydrogenase
VPYSTKGAVGAAVDRAESAFLAWSRVPLKERRAALSSIANRLDGHKEELARLLTLEVGKPIAEARSEVAASVATLRHYAGLPIEERVTTRDEASLRTFYENEPYGVTALVLPWNYPLLMMMWKAAPALLAGNSLVVKPSLFTPLANARAISIASQALPRGTVNVLPGGDDVGRRLVENRQVRRIAFTGSAENGPNILKGASASMAKVTLELGGNDPAILMPDFDIAGRFEQLFWASFRNCGQVCIAAKRVYVHESIFEDVIARYVSRVKALRIGNGLEEGTDLGPVNNEPHFRKISKLVEASVDDGGKLLVGGKRLRGHNQKHGLFYEPAIVTGLDNSSPLVQQEQFGPALPVLPYRTVDEAIDLANDCCLALGASVWSEDKDKALDVARNIKAGMVWINGHLAPDLTAPFGGMKGSGIGRELGIQGYEEYVSPKTYQIR